MYMCNENPPKDNYGSRSLKVISTNMWADISVNMSLNTWSTATLYVGQQVFIEQSVVGW